MKKTISMICWKRPDYLKKALASIGKADHSGFDSLHIFAEPEGGAEMEYLLANTAAYIPEDLPVVVHRNPNRLRVDANGFVAVSHAFDVLGADLNVHVEEDVVISPDALRLSTWYGVNASSFQEPVMCFCLHHHGGEAPTEKNVHFTKAVHGFSPYGWAATKDNWARWLKPEWFTNRWNDMGKYGWDWSLDYHSKGTHTVKVLVPVVSRANTVGEFGGVNMTPEQWRADFSKHVML